MIRPILLALASITLAGQTAALNAQFQPKYDALVRAYANKDVKGLGELLADDFNGGAADQPISKQQTLTTLRKSNSTFKTLSRKVISVVVNKAKASVIEDSVTKGTLPDPKTKTLHRFEIQMRSMDTWEKGPKGWQVKLMRRIRTKTLEDGKPFHGDPNH